MATFKKACVFTLAALLAASSAAGLSACGDPAGDGTDDDGGKGSGGKYTTITFWGGGDDNETKVFGEIVNKFNTTIGAEKRIKVNYSSGHEDYDTNAMQLSGNNPPDVVYVPDRQFKNWVSAGYLENLTDADGNPKAEYAGLDEFLAPGKIWEQGIRRYRYDIKTYTTTDTSTLWALPKDIGPSVLYYNREYLKEMGIEHISVDIGTPEFEEKGYPEKGYFEMDGKWYFNNRVPMSWEEVTALGMRMQKEIPDCKNGYFTEWWFNYGWGIGGDCVEYVSEGADANGDPMGYYEFTLDDRTPNWIVKDDCTEGVDFTHKEAGKDVTTHYSAGQVISYSDKQTLTDSDARKAKLNRLPAMYDAFLEFVSLTTPEGETVGTMTDGVTVVSGVNTSMGQNSIGTQSARDRFAAGSMGMFVGLRAEVTHLRKKIGETNGWMKDSDSWDVAPLPLYKQYDENGKVTVHGVQAGHSGSMGLAIARRSQKKAAAWELVKYIAGEEGQRAQSEAGFCIPNQIELAKSEVFLQPNQAPKNSQVFVDAAQYETPADWWYLKDWHWIDKWADCLNNQVREPQSKDHRTVEQLFDEWGDYTRNLLYAYTYSSKPGALADPNP